MITRLVICLSILSVFFFSNCFVGWAALPQVCLDAEKYKNLKIKKNLYTQCIHSGELSPRESSILYVKRGIINEHLEETVLAIQDFDRAIQINPMLYEAYIRRGIIYNNLSDLKRAIQDFEKALEIRPKDKKAYNNLAWILVASEDPQYRDSKRALKLVQTAIQISNIEDPSIFDTLAAVYAELGQFDKAIEAQAKAIKILEERGEEELSKKFREVLSDYEMNRKRF